MPSVMDRYICRVAASSMLVMLVCFYALTTLFAMVEELGREQQASGLGEALRFVLYTSPRRIYELAPYVIFLGGLIGLGTLAGTPKSPSCGRRARRCGASSSRWPFRCWRRPSRRPRSESTRRRAWTRHGRGGAVAGASGLGDDPPGRRTGTGRAASTTRVDALGADGELIGVEPVRPRACKQSARRKPCGVCGIRRWAMDCLAAHRTCARLASVRTAPRSRPDDGAAWESPTSTRNCSAARALVDPRKLSSGRPPASRFERLGPRATERGYVSDLAMEQGCCSRWRPWGSRCWRWAWWSDPCARSAWGRASPWASTAGTASSSTSRISLRRQAWYSIFHLGSRCWRPSRRAGSRARY